MKKVLIIGFCLSITTLLKSQTVTDINGNVYHTVTIGTQEWLKENLNVSKFSNGDYIPNIKDDGTWLNSSKSLARCYYQNDSVKYASVYGALYNYYTTMDDRNLCPSGWHVATNVDWATLSTYLGGDAVAGGKMMETGTSHWAAPNTVADNSSNFTALPNGWRKYDASFADIENSAYFWADSTWQISRPSRSIIKNTTSLRNLPYNSISGMAVRCVKGGTTTSIDNSTINETIIFPNPIMDYLIITTISNIDRFEVADLSGRVIINQKNDGQKINVQSLTIGIYIVNLISDGKIIKTEKIIKQ